MNSDDNLSLMVTLSLKVRVPEPPYFTYYSLFALNRVSGIYWRQQAVKKDFQEEIDPELHILYTTPTTCPAKATAAAADPLFARTHPFMHAVHLQIVAA